VAQTPTNLAWGTLFDLSATRPGPLHMRLAAAIRSAVRDGRVPLGAALPPSRTLAADLGISRWTVTQAYGQLVTEGYLTARTGSATRVSWSAPDEDQRRSGAQGLRPAVPALPVRFDLYSCQTDLRAFPRRKWVEAIAAAAQTAPFDQLDYSAAGGLPELRAVLAEHLSRSRGAAAQPDTLSIFSGAGQALIQICRALLADGRISLGVEDPGSPRFRQAAHTAGMDIVGLPVDSGGLVVAALDDHPALQAVCVGVARQVAFGVPLAAERRQQLLDWARRTGGLVIEDDYESEFGYDRPAPPVLQGTDPDHVALIGSMSQALGPTVSIGWAVAPRRLVQPVRAEDEIQLLPPALNQLALVHLMRSGAYDRHVRTIRLQLRRRRTALVDALRRQLPGYRVHGAASGMELMLELPPGTDSATVIAAAARRDLRVGSIDELRISPDPARPALMLGYGNLNDNVVDEAVTVLADVIAGAARG
jgi:GntR family transcriptional regulator / MocR family aminotransferase